MGSLREINKKFVSEFLQRSTTKVQEYNLLIRQCPRQKRKRKRSYISDVGHMAHRLSLCAYCLYYVVIIHPLCTAHMVCI